MTAGDDREFPEAARDDADVRGSRSGDHVDVRDSAAGDRPETEHADATSPDAGRRELVKWLWRAPVIALAAGGAYGAYRAIDTHFVKRRPDPTPEFEDADAQVVAPLTAFAEVWDSAEFMLAASPGVALRSPVPVTGGLSADDVHLVAFSRICTHQQCVVNLNTDVAAIGLGFNYDTDAPAITCPCHLSVFDPQQAGRAVSGPAVVPLPRARLELVEDRVVATGWERPRS